MTRTLAFGVAALALAACSSGSGGTAHPTLSHSPLPDRAGRGVIAGQFLAVGGPFGAQPSPQRGRIIVRKHGRLLLTVRVPRNGGFRIATLPGRYSLVGYTPQFHVDGSKGACRPIRPVVVIRAGHTTHVNVYCERL